MKRAEEDIRTHGLATLPTDSPARWFRWSPHRAKNLKPPDDTPNPVGDWGWVWDPDVSTATFCHTLSSDADRCCHQVNASYLSAWGYSPTTDLASAEWRAEMKRIITLWTTKRKLDGCPCPHQPQPLQCALLSWPLWSVRSLLRWRQQ